MSIGRDLQQTLGYSRWKFMKARGRLAPQVGQQKRGVVSLPPHVLVFLSIISVQLGRGFCQEPVPDDWFGWHGFLTSWVRCHRTFALVASKITRIHSRQLYPYGAVWADDCCDEYSLLRGHRSHSAGDRCHTGIYRPAGNCHSRIAQSV